MTARPVVPRTPAGDLLTDLVLPVFELHGEFLEPTPAGRSALGRLAAAQHAWANVVADTVGVDALRQAHVTVRTLIDASRGYRQTLRPADQTGAV